MSQTAATMEAPPTAPANLPAIPPDELAAAQQNAGDDEDDLAAAYDAFVAAEQGGTGQQPIEQPAGRSAATGEGGASSPDRGQDAPADPQAGDAGAADDPAAAGQQGGQQDGQTFEATPDQVQLLKRFQLQPDHISALPAEARAQFLANLQQRAEFTDRMTREMAALRRGDPAPATDPAHPAADPAASQQQDGQARQPAQQQPPAQTAPAFTMPDEAWGQLQEYLGEEGAKPLRSAVEGALGQVAGQIQQRYDGAMSALFQRIVHEDLERAFEELEVPEGVDKSDPKIRELLQGEADRLFAGGQQFDLVNFNYRHALPRAASFVFGKQARAGQQQQQAQARQSALRGSPSRSARASTVQKPALSEEQREDLAAQAAARGASFEEIQRIYNGEE